MPFTLKVAIFTGCACVLPVKLQGSIRHSPAFHQVHQPGPAASADATRLTPVTVLILLVQRRTLTVFSATEVGGATGIHEE